MKITLLHLTIIPMVAHSRLSGTQSPAPSMSSGPSTTPSVIASSTPSSVPTSLSSQAPSGVPTSIRSQAPSTGPTSAPSQSSMPSQAPSSVPTSLPSQVASTSQPDECYVEGYTFSEGIDSMGYDLNQTPNKSIQELGLLCSQQAENCLAFNDLGFLKYHVEPAHALDYHYPKNNECSGMYVKNTACPVVARYRFIPAKDSTHHDISHLPGLSVNELAEECDATAECEGFNEMGWLKYDLRSPNQWNTIAGASLENCIGIYVKECPTIPGYKFIKNKDYPSNDIRHDAFVSVEELAGTCNADATCKGFNDQGWLKRTLSNNLVDYSVTLACSGFYVKE